jgi:FecR protein
MTRRLLSVVLAASALTATEPVALTYRFDEVKSKVLRSPGGDEKNEARVTAGDTAAPGDLIRTGVWARAVVSVPERKARFEISSYTRARLAAGEPGVLLSLEKGRLKASFEALPDGSVTERRVAAPGALLAVRGTRYGLEVDGEGRCLLAVFEGTVEVLPTIVGAAPIKVHADEFCTFGARMAPRSAPMKSMGLSERSWGIAQRRQRHVAGFRRPDARDGAREPDTSEDRRVNGTQGALSG